MQIKEEDQLGNLLCWVRMEHHMLLMRLSLAEVAVVNGGGGQKTDHRYFQGNAGSSIYP